MADDHKIFREGLKLLISSQQDLHIVAELDNLAELLSTVKHSQPDLLLLDYHMPGPDTIASISYVKQRDPSLKVIVLTGSHNPSILSQLHQAKADAILLKDGSAQDLLSAIRQVMAGATYNNGVVQQLARQQEHVLTKREFQILSLICRGLTNNQIALQLNLSPKTTDKHRENLMRKLEVNNLNQLLVKSSQLGLMDTQI